MTPPSPFGTFRKFIRFGSATLPLVSNVNVNGKVKHSHILPRLWEGQEGHKDYKWETHGGEVQPPKSCTLKQVNEYPWMTGLGVKGSLSPMCGAALVSDQFLLTAAHCCSGSVH